MGFEPTQADLIVYAVQRFKHSVTLSDQMSSVGELIQTNKSLKQRCSVSNIMFFFGSKQTNLSNQAIVQSKIDLTLCIWNVMMNIAL